LCGIKGKYKVGTTYISVGNLLHRTAQRTKEQQQFDAWFIHDRFVAFVVLGY